MFPDDTGYLQNGLSFFEKKNLLLFMCVTLAFSDHVFPGNLICK